MNLFKKFFQKAKAEEKKNIQDIDNKFTENEFTEDEIIEDENNYNNPKWDEVFYARTTNDLEKMLKAVDVKTTLVNRHFLLQIIVSETYKLREQEKYKNLCLKHSELHLSEFPDIAPALKNEIGGILPRVSTFQNYATLLTEIGEYEKAISVCEMAIEYKLSDGTKSDYQGRIDRIRKKQKST
ncbi:hypothetical protein ABZI28_002392 [Flavobacterium psychrophilum]